MNNNYEILQKYINTHEYITDLEKLVLLYPNENWNWNKLTKNPNISLNFIKLFKQFINFNLITYNPNITESLIYKNQHLIDWNYLLLENNNLSDPFILYNLYKLKKIEDISLNSNFSNEIYNNYKNNIYNYYKNSYDPIRDNYKKLILSFKLFRNLRQYYKYRNIRQYYIITINNCNNYNNYKLLSEYYKIDKKFMLKQYFNIEWKEFSRNSSLNYNIIIKNKCKDLLDFDELSGNMFYYDKERYDKYIRKIQKYIRNYLLFKIKNNY